jgi:TMEM175 potassium channel family protein
MSEQSTRTAMSETARLEAFSDGVFAIAITLLIIEVPVPEVEGSESLADALLEQWPSYFAYVLSFVVIGVMWINHHWLFRDVARTDQKVLILNLLLLLAIAFVPFPTAVLAEYMREDEQQLAATLAYGGTFAVIAILWNTLWAYVRNAGLLLPSLSRARIATITRRNAMGLIYVVTLPLALISPWINIGIYAGLAVFYLLPTSD